MKKYIIGLTLAGLALTALPVSAHGLGEDKGHGIAGWLHGVVRIKHNDRFTVTGTVQSINGSNYVITIANKFNLPNATNGTVTIATDANTKVETSSDKKTALTLTNITIGSKIIASGSIVNSSALAKNIVIINSGVAVGKVTAKTDTSVTITNAITGATKTVSTDANTKVVIDGEQKTVADVAVGDSGWVKFKTVGTTIVAKFIGLFR